MWQVYDWFLEPNSGYYFMQNSCEPVHIQLNMLDYNVIVINRTYKALPNLTVTADVYSLESKTVFHQSAPVSMPDSGVRELFSLSKVLADSKAVNFVMLNLKDAAGKSISRNVYWLAADNNYTALNHMPRTTVVTSVLKREQVKSEIKWTVKFTNPTKQLAFFVNPQLINDNEEVLPAFWTANYFSLAPGESLSVQVSAPADHLRGKNQQIQLRGWNVDETRISLQKN
jgi:hypothetical protein